jgi:hypothetical protein
MFIWFKFLIYLMFWMLLSPPPQKKKQIAGSRHGTSPIFNISSSTPARKTGADDFLNSENDKHDYDW